MISLASGSTPHPARPSRAHLRGHACGHRPGHPDHRVSGRPAGERPGGQRRMADAMSSLRRAGFLVPAGLALLAGLDAALMLLGVAAPVTADRLPDVHGMLAGPRVRGHADRLERVGGAPGPRRVRWRPALLGLGALLLVSPAPLPVGKTVRCSAARRVRGASTCRCGGASATTPCWSRPSARCSASGGRRCGSAGCRSRTLLPWLVGFVVLTIAR